MGFFIFSRVVLNKQNFRIMKKPINFSFFLLLVISVFSVFSLSSCEDTPLIYDVIVENNTADELIIYDKLNDNDFHKIGEVDANSSHKYKGFLIGNTYTLEARLSDGTVVASQQIDQDEDIDYTWVIN